MKNYDSNSFTDFSLLGILLSKPVRIIVMLAVLAVITYFLGR